MAKKLSKKELKKRNLENLKKGNHDALYEDNRAFLGFLIKNFSNIAPQDELMAIANFAFVKAAQTFSLDKNIDFISYLSRVATNEILYYHRKETRKIHFSTTSYDAEVYENADGATIALHEMLADDVDIESDIINKDNARQIKELIEQLPDKERDVIKMRYGIGYKKEMSQREIHHVIGFTQSYVSRLEAKAIRNLQKLVKKESTITIAPKPKTKSKLIFKPIAIVAKKEAVSPKMEPKPKMEEIKIMPESIIKERSKLKPSKLIFEQATRKYIVIPGEALHMRDTDSTKNSMTLDKALIQELIQDLQELSNIFIA